MTQEVLKLSQEALAGLKDVEKQVRELVAENKALKEALAQTERDYERGFIDGMQKQMQSSVDKAVNAMAQPEQEQEQEPIGYLCENAVGHRYFRWKKPPSTYKPIALYTTPPQRTERPADCERCNRLEEQAYDLVGKLRVANIKLSMQPQRTWVGLTNNDLQPIAEEYRILFGSWVHDFARAIEAKLKEKNNG